MLHQGVEGIEWFGGKLNEVLSFDFLGSIVCFGPPTVVGTGPIRSSSLVIIIS